MNARVRRFVAPLAAAALCASGAPARAGFTTQDLGGSTAQFLKLGAGARAEGMGEAYTAVADGSDAMYWNPSGLARLGDKDSALFMHSALPADINYEWASYAHRLGKTAGVGVAAQYVSQPSIDQTDSSGFGTGNTFRPSDMSLAAGGAGTLPGDLGVLSHAQLGASVKYVRSTITRSVYTVAADFGATTEAFPVLDRDMRVAYSVQNLGGTLRYQLESDQLPTTLRFGAAWSLTKDWIFAGDFVEPVDNAPYFAFGTEYKLHASETATVAARAGVNTRAFGAAGGLSGVSFGLGGRFGRLSVDYAVAPLGALGMTNFASVGWAF